MTRKTKKNLIRFGALALGFVMLVGTMSFKG